jgi:hypothetical protein
MRWIGLLACMGDKTQTCFRFGKLRKIDRFQELSVNEKIIMNWTLDELDGKVTKIFVSRNRTVDRIV